MGIELNYRGFINDMSQLEQFVADMQSRCEQIGWSYRVVDEVFAGTAFCSLGWCAYDEGFGKDKDSYRPPYNDDFDDHRTEFRENINERICGIVMYPPDTEVFVFTFNPAGELFYYEEIPKLGVLSMADRMDLWDEGKHHAHIEPGWYFAHDTQYTKINGALQSQVLMTAFLRYIQKHYMHDLTVRDPTGFWHTDDLAAAERTHRSMGWMIGAVRRSLQEVVGELGDEIQIIEGFADPEPKSLVDRPNFVPDTKMGAYQN